MRRVRGIPRAGRIALAVLAALVLVLALAQLILPGIAANRISARVERYGTVESVSVSAWPAIELLWKHGDSARVRAGHLAMYPADVVKLLREGSGFDHLDIRAEALKLGSLRLTAATLHKRGGALDATALASEPAVAAALPPGLGVRLLRSEHGEVEVRASGALFGVGASVNALAAPSEGKLIAHPVGFLIENVHLTLFADPHVFVTAVSAEYIAGTPSGYRLSMSALLR
jgi:hypothetical protein